MLLDITTLAQFEFLRESKVRYVDASGSWRVTRLPNKMFFVMASLAFEYMLIFQHELSNEQLISFALLTAYFEAFLAA
jgi:hypothetical protein